ASHRPSVALVEADRHPAGGYQHHLTLRSDHRSIDQRVALAEFDGDDPTALGPAVLFQRCLFDQPIAGGHHDEVPGLVEVADREALGDLLAGIEVQQVDDRPALAIAAQLRQVINLLPANL